MPKLFVKNMVCDRCILVVQNALIGMSLEFESVELGEVVLTKDIEDSQREELENILSSVGFQIIDDRKSRIIEKIKNIIVDLVHRKDNDNKVNLSHILSEELRIDYNYISNLFSEIEGITIEKYFILQKIEKVKELLVYNELSLSEIAISLNYSSVAYLSNQFKKITGITPSSFKKIKDNRRIPLDKII